MSPLRPSPPPATGDDDDPPAQLSLESRFVTVAVEAPPPRPAPSEPRVLAVSELIRAARVMLEARFAEVRVEGEVSGLRRSGNGHLYFCLKDAEAQIDCVMFSREAGRLRFQLQDGQKVRCRGRLTIYEGRGKFQLSVIAIEPTGAGALALAFEQLKQKLAAEGLFDIGTRPWLRDLVDYYRDWTIVANGAGIDKDEQIEGEPDSWNEVYFKLAARCLSGLSLDQAGTLMMTYFDQLPDESLFDNLKIFLGESDELFFNRNSISSDMAVSIRTLAANLLRFTRGWRRLQHDRTLSSPMNISGVLSTSISTLTAAGLCRPSATCSP